MPFDATALAAHFPEDVINWRAQTVAGTGKSAMALAYIDARDVMNRLDQAVGPENWQDAYAETPKGRLICTLSIRIDGEWVSKSDGAGDTDVEGDKGAISDALKRAAVKWGIGRYLYDMPDTWADCECYPEQRNGKWIWKKWTQDGIRKLRSARVPTQSGVIDDGQWALITGLIDGTNSNAAAMCEHYKIPSLKHMTVAQFMEAKRLLEKRLPPKTDQKAA